MGEGAIGGKDLRWRGVWSCGLRDGGCIACLKQLLAVRMDIA